jgi:hypothetical protein
MAGSRKEPLVPIHWTSVRKGDRILVVTKHFAYETTVSSDVEHGCVHFDDEIGYVSLKHEDLMTIYLVHRPHVPKNGERYKLKVSECVFVYMDGWMIGLPPTDYTGQSKHVPAHRYGASIFQDDEWIKLDD